MDFQHNAFLECPRHIGGGNGERQQRCFKACSWGADVVPWIAALNSHIRLSKGSDDCRVGLERIASGLIWK